jgi:DnaK suppressor protein
MSGDHAALRATLEAELRELQSRLSSIKADASQAHSSDSAEQAQERENDEVVDAIGIETRAAIAAIQAALLRMEGGTYGRCASCGEPIAVARLQARPAASHCINCAG